MGFSVFLLLTLTMKFVKIADYPNWFWFVESADDLDTEFVDARQAEIREFIARDLYTDETKSTIRPDWITRVQTSLMFNPNYGELLSKYDKPLLIRKNGSYMMLGDDLRITYTLHSDDFPSEDITNVDIVICENDPMPEPKWVEYLNGRYPNKSILTLNLFSNRGASLVDELNVPMISFSTTFSSYDWFERILDTIIRNRWTGKTILGYSHDPTKWNIPDDIRDKVDAVFRLGNKLEMLTDLTSIH